MKTPVNGKGEQQKSRSAGVSTQSDYLSFTGVCY